MQTSQWRYTARRFLSLSLWKDDAGAFFLWPMLAIERRERRGLHTFISRWTLGIFRRRIQLEWGNETPSLLTKIELKKSWILFNQWSRKHFKKEWGTADLDKLFARRPELKPWLEQTGYHGHYHRILLIRSMTEENIEPSNGARIVRSPTS